MNCVQQKNGIRIQVMPGARNWMMVAMKFTAPSNEDVINSTMPMSQNVWPLNMMPCPDIVAKGE